VGTGEGKNRGESYHRKICREASNPRPGDSVRQLSPLHQANRDVEPNKNFFRCSDGYLQVMTIKENGNMAVLKFPDRLHCISSLYCSNFLPFFLEKVACSMYSWLPAICLRLKNHNSGLSHVATSCG